MTYSGMFLFVLPAAVLVWGWRTYSRLRNHEEMLRLHKEERERNVSACLRERESAELEHAALLSRLGVSDRWFRHAWPLTQVSLMWSGPPVTVSTAVPAALRCAAGEISRNGTDNVTCGYTADEAGTLQPGFLWHIVSRVTETGPSFFTEGAGSSTGAGAWHREFSHILIPDGETRVAILLQGTRHTPAETLSDYLFRIADQLEEGKADGVQHDDDSGWAFHTFTDVTATAEQNYDKRMQTDENLS